MGIDTHLPLAYCYAQIKCQALNSLHIEDIQLIEKLKLSLFHIEIQFAQLIKINFESLKSLSATNQYMFHLSYDNYGILAPTSWISHLWEMSYKYDVIIDGHYKRLCPIRKMIEHKWI